RPLPGSRQGLRISCPLALASPIESKPASCPVLPFDARFDGQGHRPCPGGSNEEVVLGSGNRNLFDLWTHLSYGLYGGPVSRPAAGHSGEQRAGARPPRRLSRAVAAGLPGAATGSA